MIAIECPLTFDSVVAPIAICSLAGSPMCPRSCDTSLVSEAMDAALRHHMLANVMQLLQCLREQLHNLFLDPFWTANPALGLEQSVADAIMWLDAVIALLRQILLAVGATPALSSSSSSSDTRPPGPSVGPQTPPAGPGSRPPKPSRAGPYQR